MLRIFIDVREIYYLEFIFLPFLYPSGIESDFLIFLLSLSLVIKTKNIN